MNELREHLDSYRREAEAAAALHASYVLARERDHAADLGRRLAFHSGG